MVYLRKLIAIVLIGESVAFAQLTVEVVTPPDVPAAFSTLDGDESGTLSQEEFLANGEKEPETLVRDFRVFDTDENGELSAAEFLAVPYLNAGDQRKAPPDPIALLVERRAAEIEERWGEWDRDEDGLLSEGEWGDSEIESLAPGLEQAEFAACDADEDGRVSAEELRSLLEVAYGVRHPQGRPLRNDWGGVVDWRVFRAMDRNGDGLVEKEHFLHAQRGRGEGAAREFFAALDADDDEQLTFAEYSSPFGPWTDGIGIFLNFDQDLDARLSAEELAAASLPSGQKPMTRFLLPGFDDDGDGVLSLAEFRLTPLVNLLANWIAAKDSDNNGRLTRQEFQFGDGPALAVLVEEYFRRLDVDEDGGLDLDEWVFISAHPRVRYEELDTDEDGRLSEGEVVASRLQDEQPMRRDFQVVDFDGNGFLDYGEFSTLPRLVPSEHRGALPDPVSELAEQSAAAIEERWEQYDADGNGTLDAGEFRRGGVAGVVAGLNRSRFTDWDRNGDGRLTTEETRRLLEIAYGVRRPRGDLLRGADGTVMDWRTFRALDSDNDNFITRERFLRSRRSLGVEAAEALFEEVDTDDDGQIDFDEWNAAHPWANQLERFFTLDANFDAFVDEEELRAASLPSGQVPLAPPSLPAFDLDGDGRLAFVEYRLTPLANLLAIWYSAKDRNSDGTLTEAEFDFTDGPSLDALAAVFFKRLDLNDNELLELDEWPFETRAPSVLFGQYDADGNGSLSGAEFEAIGGRDAAVLKRDFSVFDFDGNGELSKQEFLSVPHVVSRQQRSAYPDPVVARAEAEFQKLAAGWSDWDQNGDGEVSMTEFRASNLNREIPGLELTAFSDWDRDADGQIAKEEARQTLDVAWGVRHPNGRLLRNAAGVTDWRSFKSMDKDGDGYVLRDDFLYAQRGGGASAAQERFNLADRDEDGRISFDEWLGTPEFRRDVPHQFLQWDTNLDGRLAQFELDAAKLPGGQKPMVPYLLPAFDTDDDQMLSLTEFAFTPLANLLAVWPSIQDRDHDGRLGPQEFQVDGAPALAALAAEYFTRLDVDESGHLELGEWEFRINPGRAPRELVFQQYDVDGNGLLSIDEVLGDIPRPQPGQKADVKFEMRIARAEEAFRQADSDGDRMLDLREFRTDSGIEAVAPGSAAVSQTVGQEGVAEAFGLDGEDDTSTYLIISFNVLLLVAVIVYLFTSRRS